MQVYQTLELHDGSEIQKRQLDDHQQFFQQAIPDGFSLDHQLEAREFDFLEKTFADATTGETVLFQTVRATSQSPYVLRVNRAEWDAFIARGGSRESCQTPRTPLPRHDADSGGMRSWSMKIVRSQDDVDKYCSPEFLRAAKRAFFRDDAGRVSRVYVGIVGLRGGIVPPEANAGKSGGRWHGYGLLVRIDRDAWDSLKLSRSTIGAVVDAASTAAHKAKAGAKAAAKAIGGGAVL